MIKIVVGVVVIRDDKILMVQEAKQKCYGQWNIPAGHLDDGEYIFDAAKREAKEETGIDVDLLNVLQIFSTKDRPQFIYFLGRAISDEISFDKSEILDVKWIPIDKIFELNQRMPKEVMDILLERVWNDDVFPLGVIKELSPSVTKGLK